MAAEPGEPLAWLEPHRPRSELADGSGARVPASWWAGAAYDGLLCRIAPQTWVARDELTTPVQRATALAQLLPAPAVVVRASAAWIHGGGRPPDQLTVAMLRGGGTPRRHVVVHVTRLPAEDITVLGATRVTTALRTACDVLRFAPADLALSWLRRLRRVGVTDRGVMDWLVRHATLPGARRAADLLSSGSGC